MGHDFFRTFFRTFVCLDGTKLSQRLYMRFGRLPSFTSRPVRARNLRRCCVWLGLGLAAWGGCSAKVSDGPAGPSSPTGGAEGGGAGTVSVVALRRLTAAEYTNSVRDLVGVERPLKDAPSHELDRGEGIPYTPPAGVVDARRYADVAAKIAAEVAPAMVAENCVDGAPACWDDVLHRLVTKAFRRPPDGLERAAFKRLFDAALAGEGKAETGLRLVTSALLQSPYFLYRWDLADVPDEGQSIRAFRIASRLSFSLWQSMPDDALLAAAADGSIETTAGIEREARRLLAHPRARLAVAKFHADWLGAEKVAQATKSPLLFPGFDDRVREGLAAEIGALGAHVVLDGDGRLETLLTAPQAFVNVDTAPYYGLTGVGGRTLALAPLNPQERGGILTTVGFLAGHANPNQSSPISRGMFVRERLLCQPLPPPPPSVDVAPPVADPSLPTRQRFARHANDPSCAGCHEQIDPLGFAFEHYDAVGRFRAKEGALPVDATAYIVGTSDADGAVKGALELSSRLAASYDVKRCVAKRWFRFIMGRKESDEEPSFEEAYTRFQKSDFNLRELLVGIVSSSAFRTAGGEMDRTP